MKTTFLTGFLLMCACTLAAQSQPNTKTISVEVTNSWSKDKSDAPVVLKIKDLQPGFRVRSAVVMNGSEEIPSQLDDLNGDFKADELAFVMDIPKQENAGSYLVFRPSRQDLSDTCICRNADTRCKKAEARPYTVGYSTGHYQFL